MNHTLSPETRAVLAACLQELDNLLSEHLTDQHNDSAVIRRNAETAASTMRRAITAITTTVAEISMDTDTLDYLVAGQIRKDHR